MSVDTTALTPRQKLVDMLCADLNSQGWNQKNKIWFVKGQMGDEWLEFAGEFTGAPEDHLAALMRGGESGGLAPEATGLVVSTEGWAYPSELARSFKSEAELRAYWRLVPPSEHPEKVEIRHLLLASNDGEVIGLTFRRDPEESKEWAALTAANPCPTGDRTVDTARAMLGLNDSLKVTSQPTLADRISEILSTVQDVLDGSISSEEGTLRLFRSLPEPQRHEMLRDMPEDIKAQFAQLLPEDERKKYGL